MDWYVRDEPLTYAQKVDREVEKAQRAERIYDKRMSMMYGRENWEEYRRRNTPNLYEGKPIHSRMQKGNYEKYGITEAQRKAYLKNHFGNK